MSKQHELNEVVLNKTDSKGVSEEKKLASAVEKLWEDTHSPKNKQSKKEQDAEFSAKLEILDRKLHKDGGVLSGKNAKDLHIVGLGHSGKETKLLFSDKEAGKSSADNLYLVDESGRIVARSDVKDRKAIAWEKQETGKVGDRESGEKVDKDKVTEKDPENFSYHQGGDSTKAGQDGKQIGPQKDQSSEDQKSKQNADAIKYPSEKITPDGDKVVSLSPKVDCKFTRDGDKHHPEQVSIKRDESAAGDLVLKQVRPGANTYVVEGSDSQNHYRVFFDKATGDFTYKREIEDISSPSALGVRAVTIRPDGSEIKSSVEDAGAGFNVFAVGASDSGYRRERVQTTDSKGVMQSEIVFDDMDKSHILQATVRMVDGAYQNLSPTFTDKNTPIWSEYLQNESGNEFKVSFDSNTGVTKVTSAVRDSGWNPTNGVLNSKIASYRDTQLTEIFPNGVATLTPLDQDGQLHDYYKSIRTGNETWHKQRGSLYYTTTGGKEAQLEVTPNGNVKVIPRMKS